jgi:hypothetical protein
MPTLSTAGKNAALDAIRALAETGAALPNARLFMRDGTSQLASPLDLGTGSFNTASGGQMTSVNTSMGIFMFAGGDLDNFIIRARDASIFLDGTIGLIGSGADIELTNTNVTSVQTGNLGQITLAIG